MLGELVRTLFIAGIIALSVWMMMQPPKLPYAPPSASQICERFPGLSVDQCQDVAAGLVWLGMTDDMALVAWGTPDRVQRSFGPWGVHERWIYEKSLRQRVNYLDEERSSVHIEPSSTRYLFFENRVLTQWQDWRPSS